MTDLTFHKPQFDNTHIRMALIGPSGSGKTLTALKLASVLGDRIAVIDTEDDSSKLHAHNSEVKPFDVLNLSTKDAKPSNYAKAIESACQAGYDVCIIDSLTPSWYKILDAVGSNVLNWRTIGNPAIDLLLDALKGYRDRMHIIATIRAKSKVEIDRDAATHNMIVRDIGIQPIHRDGIKYEFDIVGALDEDNVLSFRGLGKQRCEALTDKTFTKPGQELGLILKHWLAGEKS